MRTAYWIVIAVVGALWSTLAWLLFQAAGAGADGVFALARAVGIDPLGVTWLAELFGAVGAVAQALVVVIWLIGAGTLLLVATMVSRAMKATGAAMREARMAAGDPAVGRTPAVEGEVRTKSISDTPPG